MSIPALIFWLLAAVAMFSRTRFYALLPWICTPFGAMAVVDPNLSFGSTILPMTVAAIIFVIRTALDPRRLLVMWSLARSFKGFAAFSIFMLYALLMAYVGPRLFAGKIDVMPVRMLAYTAQSPLAPTTSNMTQTAYMLVSWMFTLAFAADMAMRRLSAAVDEFARAILIALTLVCAAGFVDVAGGKAFLEPFRNGTYALAGYTFLGGVGRITGTFSEASAYGGTTVVLSSVAYFLRSGILSPFLRLYVAPIAVACGFGLAAASTSSTAYAGLMISLFFILMSPSFAARAVQRHWIAMMFAGGLAMVIILSTLILLAPDVFSLPLSVIDEAVLRKNQTSSYTERNAWTAGGYAVFWQSFGLGTGPGSVRVSSWPAAIASNVGLVGVVTMGLTLIQAYQRRGTSDSQPQMLLRLSGKAMLGVLLVMGYLAGTTVDPGVTMGAAFALIWAGSARLSVFEDRSQQMRVRAVPFQKMARLKRLGASEPAA